MIHTNRESILEWGAHRGEGTHHRLHICASSSLNVEFYPLLSPHVAVLGATPQSQIETHTPLSHPASDCAHDTPNAIMIIKKNRRICFDSRSSYYLNFTRAHSHPRNAQVIPRERFNSPPLLPFPAQKLFFTMASGGIRICHRSGKKIYPADTKFEFDGMIFHSAAFTCKETGVKLTRATSVILML